MYDYEIQRCTRRCWASGRELRPGEVIYSVLVREQGTLVRRDYSQEAWSGEPGEVVAWWKTRIPDSDTGALRPAPQEVLLGYFEQLLQQTAEPDKLYVTTLLLIRRKVLRLEAIEPSEPGRVILKVFAPQKDATYCIPVVPPEEARLEVIQREITQLLFTGAPEGDSEPTLPGGNRDGTPQA